MTSALEPQVGIVMGSDSDWKTMQAAAETLAEFAVPYQVRVISAHRTPEAAARFAREAETKGFRVLIAAAGGAAHLGGVLAAFTPLPVIGVPIQATPLAGLDSLLSIVQMPSGVPVACVAVNGAKNAALLAVQILGTADPDLRLRMAEYKESMRAAVEAKDAKFLQENITII